MKPFKFLFAAFAVFMAFACTPQEEIDSLTMGSTEINVSYEGEEKTLEFTTNTAWKIESDSDWVTFDVEEGVAGEATVVMTIAANTTYEARTAAVTITAGTLFTEYVINQGFATEFGAGMEYTFDFLPQVLEIDLNTNAAYEVSVSEDAASWITSDAITKAAPVKGSVIFSIALNSGEERSGEIYIKAGNITQTIVVNQAAFEGTVMTSVEELTYLGKTSLIYDEVSYEFPMFDEHFLSLTNEKGDALTLSFNNEVLEDAMSALPAGEYLPDANGSHDASTFTLYDGKTGYYTSATLNGAEVNFFDGLITVEVNEKVYKIIADLYDATGAPYSFAFIGELPEMEDKSNGLDATVKFEGQYETYFTTKANKFSLQFYAAKKSEGVDQFVRSMNISIYAPESADPAVLPVGTYTFAEPGNSTDLTWANGIKLAEPNMMTYFYGSDDSYAGLSASEGSMVTISKNADGTYKFAFDLTLSGGYWDYETDPNGTYVEISEFDYAVEYDDVKVGEVVSNVQKITLNGDDEFKTVMSPQYVGMWWGDKWATGGSAFTVGFSGTSVNNVYEIYLTINQSKEYVFEKNMAGKYCSTPLETGVYTFAKTPVAGQRNIVPAKYGSNVYSYVKNGYTGTKMPICGGSLTLNNDSIEFNLEVADGDKVYKMTGTIGATLYYARDYTKNAKNLGLIE